MKAANLMRRRLVVVNDEKKLEKIALTRLVRLNGVVSGIVVGLMAGLAIFIATNWLILKGGPIGSEGEPVIGPHLWLLSNYFVGYGVTFVGSLVGFAYAFAIGFGIAYLVARMYNWLVDLRHGRPGDEV
jgi:hypothetical protein